MSRYYSKSFTVEASNPPTPSFNGNLDSNGEVVKELGDKTVTVWEATGQTITANITVQGMVEGGQWINVATALSAAGFVLVPQTVEMVRISVSGHSAGDIRAAITGLELRAS